MPFFPDPERGEALWRGRSGAQGQTGRREAAGAEGPSREADGWYQGGRHGPVRGPAQRISQQSQEDKGKEACMTSALTPAQSVFTQGVQQIIVLHYLESMVELIGK